jgi:hypothetical protein
MQHSVMCGAHCVFHTCMLSFCASRGSFVTTVGLPLANVTTAQTETLRGFPSRSSPYPGLPYTVSLPYHAWYSLLPNAASASAIHTCFRSTVGGLVVSQAVGTHSNLCMHRATRLDNNPTCFVAPQLLQAASTDKVAIEASHRCCKTKAVHHGDSTNCNLISCLIVSQAHGSEHSSTLTLCS